MKKDTLIEIILGTIGGLIFAIGMCLCLIPEWNMLKLGIIISLIGFLILLLIIPVYKKFHPKKQSKPIDKGIITAWLIGIIGALVMGYGMSRIMPGSPSEKDIIIGILCGVIGLIVCVLDYPIYSYIKKKD